MFRTSATMFKKPIHLHAIVLITIWPCVAMTVNIDGTCPIVVLVPFTDKGKQSSELSVEVGFSFMASALLAIDHFNARDSSVVPELAYEEFASCDVRIPVTSHTLADDGNFQTTAAAALLDAHEEEGGNICAVVGPYNSKAALGAGIVSAAMNVPMLSYYAETAKLGRPSLYPLTARITADEYSRADAVISYLKNYRKRDYVILLHTTSMTDVLKVMGHAAKKHKIKFRAEAISPPWTHDGAYSVPDAMRLIKESGYRTIVAAFGRMSHWKHIYEYADQYRLTGPGYFWMSYDTTDLNMLISKSEIPSSPRLKMISGAGMVRVLDGFAWNSDDDFVRSWRLQNSTFVRRLNSMHPIQHEVRNGTMQCPPPGYYRAYDDYFQTHDPLPYSGYVYDAVMALGMAACGARAQWYGSEGSEVVAENRENKMRKTTARIQSVRKLQIKYPDTGTDDALYNELVKLEFTGASGTVVLHDGIYYTRDAGSVAFGMFNIRADKDVNTTTGERKFHSVLTAVRHPWEEQWTDVPGEKFVFADGTTNEPKPLRDVPPANYLSNWVRVVGLTSMSGSLALSMGTGVWVFFMRKSRIVRAAQPVFLYWLCLGSFITVLSLLTLSFDEGFGLTEEQLSRACMVTPWLFVLGYIVIYSALFSKLWRVNRVLQFSRRKVGVRHVIGPMAVTLLVAILLLSIWTALDPWTWQRAVINEETGETYGKCESVNGRIYFVPLLVIMLLTTLLAGFMAWKTRDVSNQYSETDWIFYAIFAQVQVWVVALPVLVILQTSSANATYLGRSMIISTFATTMVILIIGPKVVSTYKPDQLETRRRGSMARAAVTGTTQSSRLATLSNRSSNRRKKGEAGMSLRSNTGTVAPSAVNTGAIPRISTITDAGMSTVTDEKGGNNSEALT